jgi:anaerobic selenocysteine-containing dehydrogenase
MKLPHVSRRTFLEVSASTGAVAAAAPRLLHAMENDLGGKDIGPVTAVERRAVPTNCHVCNIQDGAIAYLENDRVVKLEGNPEHVSTRGRLCAKGNSGMWYSYDPDRILYPLKRVGARGEGKWKRITWDEALTELAGKLNAALKEDPNTIMMKYGRNRTGGTIDRFMQTLQFASHPKKWGWSRPGGQILKRPTLPMPSTCSTLAPTCWKPLTFITRCRSA